MNKKTAIVTGVTGQDGSYLSEFLLKKEYDVYGMMRRSSVDTRGRLTNILDHPNFHLIEGDVTDSTGIMKIVRDVNPDEIYNLAAQSHVGTSFNQPLASIDINTGGVVNILEAIRQIKPDCKYYQASTSELYGDTKHTPQDETTPFSPVSPYAISKLASFHFVKMYRNAYNIFASNGILYNHESPRRGDNFVTRKITKYVANLYLARQHGSAIVPPLELGNLDSMRDWGDARDFVVGMWMILQHNKPDDFILATGHTRSIKDFLDVAFKQIGINDWSSFVMQKSDLMRPCEVPLLLGDVSKASRELGWSPRISFNQMVADMIANDIVLQRKNDG